MKNTSNAFTAGNSGFVPLKTSQHTRVVRNLAPNRNPWNQSIPSPTMESKMAATLRASQIDALQRQVHGR